VENRIKRRALNEVIKDGLIIYEKRQKGYLLAEMGYKRRGKADGTL
jgi:hypothetical protein